MASLRTRLASTSASAARQGVATLVSPDRLLLAAKGAVAAVLAWLVARSLPGFLDQYAYYAPFGAVVAMMPSVVDSLRTGLHTLLGLAVGGGIAVLAYLVGLPGLATVAIVIVVAILVAGLLPPGPGRDYVPVAAIFVLMSSGGDPEMFGTAYVVLTGMGLVIGTIVHLAILPPLRTLPVDRRLEALRASAASLLDDLATQLDDAEQPVVSLEDRGAELQRAVDETQAALTDAQRTRRVNVRALGGRHTMTMSTVRFGELRATVRELVSLASVVSDERTTLAVPDELPAALRSAVADVLRRLGRAVEGEDGDDELRAACDDAARALRDWDAPSIAAAAAAGALGHHVVALEQRIRGRSPQDD
ncbi:MULTISPECIES: aromatic acid exporter family protein [unclassified Agrococcus]|uniref:FUSC family protein n=1 Tax=unclassified Agrococcus TaxID=2615065 RepID=UPI00361DFE9F